MRPSSKRIANLLETTSKSPFLVFQSSTGHSLEMQPHLKKVSVVQLTSTKCPETKFSVKITTLNPIGTIHSMIWPLPSLNSSWNVKKLAGNGLANKLDQVHPLSSHQKVDKNPSQLLSKLKNQLSPLLRPPLKKLNQRKRFLPRKWISEASGLLLTSSMKLLLSKVKMFPTSIQLECLPAKTPHSGLMTK